MFTWFFFSLTQKYFAYVLNHFYFYKYLSIKKKIKNNFTNRNFKMKHKKKRNVDDFSKSLVHWGIDKKKKSPKNSYWISKETEAIN